MKIEGGELRANRIKYSLQVKGMLARNAITTNQVTYTHQNSGTSNPCHPSIAEQFAERFALRVANTPEMREEVYRIRYQVYCQELGYEPPGRFPDGKETDEFDERSLHCLLEYLPSGMYIGCVRLVFVNPDDPNDRFPFERTCGSTLQIELNESVRPYYCEVSRLAVIGAFRKRKGEATTTSGLIYTEDNDTPVAREKRRFPLIAPSLFLACTSLVLNLGLESFTLMEPRLARHLRTFGMPSTQIGSLIEHRGKRAPYMMKPREIVESIGLEALELFQAIDEKMQIGLRNWPSEDKLKSYLDEIEARQWQEVEVYS